MKTILFKIWKFPQLSETFIVNQIIMAIKLGYKVKILVGDLNELEGNCNMDLLREYELEKKIILENYEIPHERWPRIKKAFELIIFNISSWHYLFKYAMKSSSKGIIPVFEFYFLKQFKDIDIIHVQFGTNKYPWDILKAIGFIKTKLIVSFHGHDIHFPIGGKIKNNGYYKNLFKVADHLVCNTKFLQDKIISLEAPLSKIKVLPVAVDTNFFKPNLKLKQSLKIKLLTVGRLDELKGQSFGIAAVRSLLLKGYKIEYTIVGSGDYFNKLQSDILDLELEESIHMLGALTPSEILPILQNSDIFLMTSITNQSGMAESQGLVTAEAQACGLPIVAFDSGGIKYTVQENVTAFLCTEKDIECYANKIEKLLLNDKLRKEMGESARKFIKREYSEKAILAKWKLLYS